MEYNKPDYKVTFELKDHDGKPYTESVLVYANTLGEAEWIGKKIMAKAYPNTKFHDYDHSLESISKNNTLVEGV